MIKIRHWKHIADAYPCYCNNCSSKVKCVVTIYEKNKDLIMIYEHCDRCLVDSIISRITSKNYSDTGLCRFCDNTGPREILYGNACCQKCLVALYEYVAGYLEGG